MSESQHSALRLRSAGFGVVAGGSLLLPLSLLLPPSGATGTLLAVAFGLAIAGRNKETWWFQFCFGVSAVGAIGLIEATTSVGLGFEPLALGAVAIAFGLFDIVAGTLIHRFRPGPE